MAPETGLLLLHKHGDDCLLVCGIQLAYVLKHCMTNIAQHEGREVTAGEKWILRTDICVAR